MKLRLAIASFALAILSAFASAEVDRSTPEKTLESFSRCIETKDYDGLLSCVKGAKPNDFMKAMFSPSGPALALKIAVEKIERKLDSATVWAKVTMSATGKEDQGDDTLRLVKEGNFWLLVSETTDPKSKRFASQLIESLAEPDQIFVKAKQNAMATVCKRNIKDIGAGLLALAAKNGGVLKVKNDTWQKAVAPFARNGTVLKCPLDKGGPIGYSLNAALVGKKLSSIREPSKTILLYEGKNGKLEYRHGGKAAVALADGATIAVTPAEAKNLIWKP